MKAAQITGELSKTGNDIRGIAFGNSVTGVKKRSKQWMLIEIHQSEVKD